MSMFILFKEKSSYNLYNKYPSYFKKWCIISVLSSLFGFLFFLGNVEWQNAALELIPKILMYYLFFSLLSSSLNALEYCKYLVRGLIYGMIFNIIVAVLDAVVFYLSGYSIVNEYFKYYISLSDIRYGMISLVLGPTIRSCGLNIDPANIGLFVTVLAAYSLKSKNVIYYIFSVLGVLASLSHTGFLGIVIVTIIHYITNRNWKVLIRGIVAASIVAILFSMVPISDINGISQMGEAFIERSEEKLDSDGVEEAARMSYWGNFIPAAIGQPSALLIGTGYGTASYAYLKNKLVDTKFFPYDPEQTYFSTYFDIGLLGFIFFFTLLFGLTKLLYRRDNAPDYVYIISSGLIGSMIAFAGYHYTVYSVYMLFLIAGIIIVSYKPIQQETK